MGEQTVGQWMIVSLWREMLNHLRVDEEKSLLWLHRALTVASSGGAPAEIVAALVLDVGDLQGSPSGRLGRRQSVLLKLPVSRFDPNLISEIERICALMDAGKGSWNLSTDYQADEIREIVRKCHV